MKHRLSPDTQLRNRQLKSLLFYSLCAIAALVSTITLFILVGSIAQLGWQWISWDFLTKFSSRRASDAGIYAALIGSLHLAWMTAAIAIPLGIGTAVYLEEFLPPSRAKSLIDTNIANLASVPSIVFGLLGLALFVRDLHMGRSLIAGALTLAILSLPVIVIASREALRGVPMGLREAAFALGATRWQVTWAHVLRAALPTMLTGIILAMSRAFGESAPLMLVGAASFVAFLPVSIFDPFTAMPIQIYGWTSRPQPEFQELAAAGILVLLAIILTLNGSAMILRHYLGEKHRS